VAPRAQAVDDLCDGKVHIALASPEEFSRRDVEFRLFFTDPILLIVPNDHPWAYRGEIEPEELLEADFILREEGSGTRQVAANALADIGLSLSELNVILTLGNSEAIALAVQEGLGVGFVSRFVSNRLVRSGVAPVKVCGLSLHQDVYIAQNTRQQATKAQTAFWQFVTDPENPILQQLVENGLQDMLLAELYA
jgi:DNA-binding transcriptional LysR family regulator